MRTGSSVPPQGDTRKPAFTTPPSKAASPSTGSTPPLPATAAANKQQQPITRVRAVLRHVRWLAYEFLVLLFSMGFGIKWVMMLVRTMIYGIVLVPGFLSLIWYYIRSPYVLRRIRYSTTLVDLEPISLASVTDNAAAATFVDSAMSFAGPRNTPAKAARASNNTANTSMAKTASGSTLTYREDGEGGAPIPDEGSSSGDDDGLLLGTTAASMNRSASFGSSCSSCPDDDDDDDEGATPAPTEQNPRAFLDIFYPLPLADVMANGPEASSPSTSKPPSSGSSANGHHHHHHSHFTRAAAAAAQHAASWIGLQNITRHNVEATSAGFPVVVVVTGGAWIIGWNLWMTGIARVLSACGFVVVVPDYRNYPQARIPEMVDDVDDALQWVTKHIQKLHGDPSRVYVMGQSAGAHLVFMSMLRQVNALHRAATATASGTTPPMHPLRPEGGEAVLQDMATSRTLIDPITNYTPCHSSPVRPGRAPARPLVTNTAGYVAKYDPRKAFRAVIGLSGMYNLHEMADYLHGRGLYRSVLLRIAADSLEACSATHCLRHTPALALRRYLPQRVLFIHGNCDYSAPHAESVAMMEILRLKLIDAKDVVEAMPQKTPQLNGFTLDDAPPSVELMTIRGGTHTSAGVTDFLSGRSYVAGRLCALDKECEAELRRRAAALAAAACKWQGVTNDARAVLSRPVKRRGLSQEQLSSRSSSVAPSVSSAYSATNGHHHHNHTKHGLLSATVGSTESSASSDSQGAARENLDGELANEVRAVKFRPLVWPWQTTTASYFSAF